MLELAEVVSQLTQKDTIVLQGERYKIANAAYITDGEILKTRLLLRSDSGIEPIDLDIAISARIYKR